MRTNNKNKKAKNNRNSNGSGGKSHENLHIPKYIRDQPWYYKDNKQLKKEKDNDTSDGTSSEDRPDYLVHHRQDKDKNSGIGIDNNNEAKVGKGINDEFVSSTDMNDKSMEQCDNCGLQGHVMKDCIELPQKKKRKYMEENEEKLKIQIRKDHEKDYDAKQDRWFGYDGSEYDEALAKWQTMKSEGAKKELNEEENDIDINILIEITKLGLDVKESLTYLEDCKEIQKGKSVTSVRLREDKAAYLNDINNTNHETNYDPKSRIYKSEELGKVDDKGKIFRRHLTGEGKEFNALNELARELSKKEGIKDEVKDIGKINHVLIANPTKYDQLKKRQQQQKERDSASETKKIVELKDCEAKKVTGTTISKKSKNLLKDLYG
ncbi:hypothetical protein TBLA_0F03730 [Henningerozyma blattae CBS 6284]|uniref:Pre-mRNA-splicing factor SLU7 n=1 Tax=Henningerozyma blattae (strain ATCC 34711 / CBS 6284 / DSM 70876 / NBRC 10599 / NRRL Y-10934 / UCD 77-7) TaxID=1071380 RepID=I2H6A6_HENB6|nr:hypothetical protein TBLA_0F03730 [Tetrapisispora blattae CBS 6284]CCH61908.1 hypothetical protein TBLA_0F03730 [Tetrapisispora blattae CBS 6284]